MKEGITKHRALLGVELFEVSNDYIFKLREGHPDPHRVFKLLPEYTLNSNKGEKFNHMILAEDHHQWVGHFEPTKENNEKYLYFNLKTIDNLLLEEINNSGMECLFDEFDFQKILSKFKPQSTKDATNLIFPIVNYLIVDIDYQISYDHYSGGYECDDIYVNIVGYLDNNYQIQLFNHE